MIRSAAGYITLTCVRHPYSDSHFNQLTSNFCSDVESQGNFIWKVFAVRHVGHLSLLQQAHFLPLMSQRCPLLVEEC